MDNEEEHVGHEEQLRLLVDNSPDVITLLNRDRERVYISGSVAQMTGYTPDELMGEPFDAMRIHPDDLSDVKKALDLMDASPGADVRVMYRHRHKDEGYRYVETIGRNLCDNPGIGGTLLISRDCTRMRQEIDLLRESIESLGKKNQDLHETNTGLTLRITDLESQVREHTDDVEDKNDEIEQLLKQKDEFIYQLAHDLRTPLTPVVAMLPLLAIGIQDPDAKALLEIFNTSIQYLQKMVENVIYYSQLNRQYSITDYADYMLLELIDEALEGNGFLTYQKEVNIGVDIPETIRIRLSRTHARQLFSNLINNAVKFNVYKGEVLIRARHEKNGVTITISDTGVGIPEDKIDKIWNEFMTGDAARKDPEAKGLGLPIVRQIVTLHQGTIRASSKGTGKGTTITLWLPDEPV
ncbi:PAS domain-containing sensor histidine kinase [uncultured Methanospirillum sp.]|uniref:PAS domain-containing sensor histidine kinase n=1 Tax=uncultured Methanospirillum sp. TaxID=262503 RepID=UPI0029C99C72|nr:PAS domain-containing sensor histidine kinase [uncultured Methanospirillum sp.]